MTTIGNSLNVNNLLLGNATQQSAPPAVGGDINLFNLSSNDTAGDTLSLTSSWIPMEAPPQQEPTLPPLRRIDTHRKPVQIGSGPAQSNPIETLPPPRPVDTQPVQTGPVDQNPVPTQPNIDPNAPLPPLR